MEVDKATILTALTLGSGLKGRRVMEMRSGSKVQALRRSGHKWRRGLLQGSNAGPLACSRHRLHCWGRRTVAPTQACHSRLCCPSPDSTIRREWAGKNLGCRANHYPNLDCVVVGRHRIMAKSVKTMAAIPRKQPTDQPHIALPRIVPAAAPRSGPAINTAIASAPLPRRSESWRPILELLAPQLKTAEARANQATEDKICRRVNRVAACMPL